MNETSTGASTIPCDAGKCSDCKSQGDTMSHPQDKDFVPHPILDHHHPDHHNNHVHFDNTDVKSDGEEDNGIRYKLTEPQKNIVTIHLGFLQVQHRYKLALQLPLHLCAATQKLATDAQDQPFVLKLEQPETENGLPNLWCKLLEYSKDVPSGGQTLDMVVEFMAHKEKFLRENMTLMLNDTEKITIVFTARVLGRGKGTPLLRNGIQSVSIELDDEESTSSDATTGAHH